MTQFTDFVSKGKIRRYNPFDCINNFEDAYLIGYLSSDGTYSMTTKVNGKQYPRMGVTSTTIETIEYFRDNYCPDTIINYREPRSSEKVNAVNPTAEFWFPSIYKNIFPKYGIYCHKPERDLLNIPVEYMGACLLGVMDADGCFVKRDRDDCRITLLNVHIVSSAYNILTTIKDFVKDHLEIDASIYQRKDKEYYELRINNTNSSFRFGEFIYSQLPKKYNLEKFKLFQNYYNYYTSDVLSA